MSLLRTVLPWQSSRNSLRLFAVALNYNPNNHIWKTTT